MSNLQQYTLIYVTVDDAILTEEGSVDVKMMTDAQIIKTVAKGFAGVSPGAPMCEIDVTSAIPSAGFELDPSPYMKSLQVVEMGLQLAGEVKTSKGFIIDGSFRHAVDSPSGLSFRFMGTFPE